MSSPPKDDPYVKIIQEQEEYWKAVKAGKLPDPLQTLEMKASKEAMAKEIFELKQCVARQTQVINDLTQKNMDLGNQVFNLKNRQIRQEQTMPPVIPVEAKLEPKKRRS